MSGGVLLRGGRAGLGGPVADILVLRGRIVSIRPEGMGVESDVEVVVLQDSTVLPGMVDGHVHVDQWAHNANRIDVSQARSAQEATQTIGSHLLSRSSPHDEGATVTAHGYTDGLWPDAPHRSILDAQLGGVRVAVFSKDLHAVWLNSAALASLDRAGHPTGVLREAEAVETMQRLMELEPDELIDDLVIEATRHAARRGVTAMIDFSVADNLAHWTRRYATHDVPMRIHAAVWAQWLESAIEQGRRTGDSIAETNNRLTVGPFKVAADGSLNTRTAWCHDRYPISNGEGGGHGFELASFDELVEQMSRAWAAGLESAVHAIGDRANTVALDAFEAVGCRGRIEHAQLIRAADLERFNRPGLTASVQPQHAVLDRDVADRHWEGRTGRAFAYLDLYKAGARLEFGSDAPVSPVDPWIAISDAVTRTDDDRPPWHPEQALPLEVAVAAACGGRTRVTEGARADLTIVSGDPQRADSNALRHTPVIATMVGGEFTHRADEL